MLLSDTPILPPTYDSLGNLDIISREDANAIGGDASALEPAILTLLSNSIYVALLQLQLISLTSSVGVQRHITVGHQHYYIIIYFLSCLVALF